MNVSGVAWAFIGPYSILVLASASTQETASGDVSRGAGRSSSHWNHVRVRSFSGSRGDHPIELQPDGIQIDDEARATGYRVEAARSGGECMDVSAF
jgi:hypothetical protein